MNRKLLCAIGVVALSGSAAFASFQFNPEGTFQFAGASNGGAECVITDVGQRTVDSAFLGRVQSALLSPVNGYTSNLTPVAADLGLDITLDRLVTVGDDSSAYPGGGWSHWVRYNGADLDGWKVIWMFGRQYAPDATEGFANYSYEECSSDSYEDEYLQANFPFVNEYFMRNGTNAYGAYEIFEATTTTWFTIRGGWLEMENTFVIARQVGETLEVGGAWGFHERVTVPAPAAIAMAPLALFGMSRRRR